MTELGAMQGIRLEPHPCGAVRALGHAARKGVGRRGWIREPDRQGDTCTRSRPGCRCMRARVDCIFIDPPYNTGNEGLGLHDKT